VGVVVKVVPMNEDARFNPERCVQALITDIKSGAVKPRRLIVVMEVEDQEELDIRGSGPGLDYVPTTVGLLHCAIVSLVQV
jgi:hypothetical protein